MCEAVDDVPGLAEFGQEGHQVELGDEPAGEEGELDEDCGEPAAEGVGPFQVAFPLGNTDDQRPPGSRPKPAVEEVPDNGQDEAGQSHPGIVQQIEDLLGGQEETGGSPPARKCHYEKLSHQQSRCDQDRIDADCLQSGDGLPPAVPFRRVMRRRRHQKPVFDAGSASSP